MAGNSFGQIFKIATWGESHGPGIGVVIDGCPSGMPFDEIYLNAELSRRKPGQSAIVTQRKESDRAELLSGVFEGYTTGMPIAIWIPNKNAKSQDYDHIKDKFRPSHADFTYQMKYGRRDYRGGGRSSARETAARVAAGAVAKMILTREQIDVFAYVSSVGPIHLKDAHETVLTNQIELNDVRCPDPEIAEQMEKLIREVRKEGDTVGGVVTCVIRNCPIGLGEPVFDKLHADLAKAMLSINACKGFEYGSGFAGVEMRGSEHNDAFLNDGLQIKTETNHSGGIQGGISNGMDIYFRVAFKPVATIMQNQESVDEDGKSVTVAGKGRHDPCVVPRAVPIVEAMASLVLTDHLLRNRLYQA